MIMKQCRNDKWNDSNEVMKVTHLNDNEENRSSNEIW